MITFQTNGDHLEILDDGELCFTIYPCFCITPIKYGDELKSVKIGSDKGGKPVNICLEDTGFESGDAFLAYLYSLNAEFGCYTAGIGGGNGGEPIDVNAPDFETELFCGVANEPILAVIDVIAEPPTTVYYLNGEVYEGETYTCIGELAPTMKTLDVCINGLAGYECQIADDEGTTFNWILNDGTVLTEKPEGLTYGNCVQVVDPVIKDCIVCSEGIEYKKKYNEDANGNETVLGFWPAVGEVVASLENYSFGKCVPTITDQSIINECFKEAGNIPAGKNYFRLVNVGDNDVEVTIDGQTSILPANTAVASTIEFPAGGYVPGVSTPTVSWNPILNGKQGLIQVFCY